MAGEAFRIVHELDADAVRPADYVPIGQDVAFGIDDNTGAERALADALVTTVATRTTRALPAKEPVEEILERIVLVVIAGRGTHAPATVRILNRGFSIDVYDRRFNLLGHLREGIGQLLWLRYGERGGVRGVHLPLTGVHAIRNHGSN